jgi:hypothetical protein
MDNSGSQKRKKSKHRNHGSCEKDNASSTPVSVSRPNKNGKLLTWGEVEQVTFAPSLGACVVPHRGVFPLGLGSEIQRMTLSVDDHVRLRQAELIDRINSKGLRLSVSASSASNISTAPPSIADYNLETRQYDHKPSSFANPLFRSVSEQDRRVILCQEIIVKGNRLRSDSHNNLSNGKTSAEHMSESEINKELDTVRHSREQSGCNCKPMKVDKLSFGKIKSLLSARAVDIGLSSDIINSLSKAEACDWMRKLIKICPICVAGNCACIALEVECSAELCSCLRRVGSLGSRCNRSDSVDSTEADGLTVSDNRCGNIFGQVIFDPDVVDQYRRNIIRSLKGEDGTAASLNEFDKLRINHFFDVPAPCKL